MFINLKFKWRQSLPQIEPIPAQGLFWTIPNFPCLHGLISIRIHQCTAGIWPVCSWTLEFWDFILFYFYYTAPSVQSVPPHRLEMGCTNKERKTCLKEEVSARLKLLLIHYLRIHHVLVSAPFKQVFKHSLGGKAAKSVRGSLIPPTLGVCGAPCTEKTSLTLKGLISNNFPDVNDKLTFSCTRSWICNWFNSSEAKGFRERKNWLNVLFFLALSCSLCCFFLSDGHLQITGSENHLGWKRHPQSSSPTINSSKYFFGGINSILWKVKCCPVLWKWNSEFPLHLLSYDGSK